DDVGERRAGGEYVVHRARQRPDVEVADRRVGLRVEVDQQRAAAALGQGRAQVDGGGGLPHSTLLVGDGDDDHLGPPLARTTGVASTTGCSLPPAGVGQGPERRTLQAAPTSGTCRAPRPRGSRATSGGG